MNSLRVAILGLVAIAATGCMRYTPSPVEPSVALRSSRPPAGPISYEAAVRWAIEHNPELRALAWRADAVAWSPASEPLAIGVGRGSDTRAEAGLSLDALSLLGLGTRRAEEALACARRDESWMAFHERARAIAGEIAELYAVDAAMAAMPPYPAVGIDVRAFVNAGLDAPASEAAALATESDVRTENAERATQRRAFRSAVARLLGLGDAAIELAPTAPNWPTIPKVAPEALATTRIDVQRRVASFEVADRALRRAVAAQWPGLVLEPQVALDPSTLFGLVTLRIPIGAGREVRAAESEREAARADVDAAVLAALQDARDATDRFAQAERLTVAARTRLDASTRLGAATKTRLQVAGGSVTETLFAQDAVLASAKALREALVDEARARARAAVANGWPSPLATP